MTAVNVQETKTPAPSPAQTASVSPLQTTVPSHVTTALMNQGPLPIQTKPQQPETFNFGRGILL